MMRAAWNGSVSFVQIAVELFAADERGELSFTLLDRRDLSPVGYERINKKTGQVVPWDQAQKSSHRRTPKRGRVRLLQRTA